MRLWYNEVRDFAVVFAGDWNAKGATQNSRIAFFDAFGVTRR